VVAVKEVVDGDELMIITRSGQLIRMPVKGISVLGRNTQGVRLVNLAAAGEKQLFADKVTAVTRMVSEEGDAPEAPEIVGALEGSEAAADLLEGVEDAGDGGESEDDSEA
jgi:DNA gyrase subunit A